MDRSGRVVQETTQTGSDGDAWAVVKMGVGRMKFPPLFFPTTPHHRHESTEIRLGKTPHGSGNPKQEPDHMLHSAHSSPRFDTNTLTRLPLPAILADHGFQVSQTGPNRFTAFSPKDVEDLTVSRLPDGKWLYKNQNNAFDKGNALNFLMNRGETFPQAAKSLGEYQTGPSVARADGFMRDLEGRYRDAGRDELQSFQRDIPLNRFVEAHGWTLDAKESTRTWEKYRGPGDDAIVINPDKNFYFHQQNKDQDKGGVIEFTRSHVLPGASLGDVRKMLRDFTGDKRPEWALQAAGMQARVRQDNVVELPTVTDRKEEWKALPMLTERTREYLTGLRGLAPETLDAYGKSIRSDIHEMPSGGHLHNVAFAHVALDADRNPVIAGWEKKGQGKEKTFNGFHGNKGIAVFKHKDFDNPVARGADDFIGRDEDGEVYQPASDAGFCQRLVLCESSIDALSKAQMDGCHPGDIYVSMGGTPSASAENALSALIRKHEPDEVLIAFDNDDAGHGFALSMEKTLAEKNQHFNMPMICTRTVFPPDGAKDWNDLVRPSVREAPHREASMRKTSQAQARDAGIGIGG
ncbi:toprim domain-containing protein [Acidithiobacillus sp. MC6.1]|nr:toprim domain-containing protein [Acidithiobacillus sp. MC6.1]